MVEAVGAQTLRPVVMNLTRPRMPDAPGNPIQVLRDRYVTTPRVSFWVNS
jgi:hypothetical protein